jgi:hypothetical protein
MADILKNITAVETLLILEEGETSFNDLFKCVTLDLLLKKVIFIKLEIIVRDYRYTSNIHYTTINKGEFYDDYEFNLYEIHFQKILDQYDGDIKLKDFRNELHNQFDAEFDWIEEIIKISSIKKLFKENYFLKYFGNLPLNDLGNIELKNITETLNTSYNYTNPLYIFNTLTNLGSNIFHLRNFHTNELLKINNLDFKSIELQNNNYLHNKFREDSNYFNEELIVQFDIKRWF